MTGKEKAQEQLQAFIDMIPTNTAEQIRQAASVKSGIPAEQLTLLQAVELLGQGGNLEIDKAAEETAEKLFAGLTEQDFSGAEEAATSGDIMGAARQMIETMLGRAQITIKTGAGEPGTTQREPDTKAAREAIKESGEKAKQIGLTFRRFAEGLSTALKLAETPQAFKEDLKETIEHTAELIKIGSGEILDYLQSDRYKAILQNLATLEELEPDIIAAAGAKAREVTELLPFIRAEVSQHPDAPEIQEATLPDLIRTIVAEGDQEGNPWRDIVETAKASKEEFESAREVVQELQELPQIIAKQAENIEYPLDKPNSVIWNMLAGADPDGQLSLDIVTSKKGSKQDAIIYYGINFDELSEALKITKQLTPFDKRVYIAAGALFNAGNNVFSTVQIYKAMGNKTRPAPRDTKKINESLTKMGAARVYIDNIKETQEAKGYKHFKYDAALLPFERISASINGQTVESAVHLFREPPLISFAKQRNQITTLTPQLLESPISKTDENLRIDDYLLERIGHMKSGKGKAPRKMLFVTIFSNCNITAKKQKQRAPEKIRRYLDHYKSTGWITGYQEDADGVTILL